MFNDGIMNESLYINDFMLFVAVAVTLLILLTCLLPVVHIMSTVLVIPLTIVALHCNVNGRLIAGLLVVLTSTVMIGPINYIKSDICSYIAMYVHEN